MDPAQMKAFIRNIKTIPKYGEKNHNSFLQNLNAQTIAQAIKVPEKHFLYSCKALKDLAEGLTGKMDCPLETAGNETCYQRFVEECGEEFKGIPYDFLRNLLLSDAFSKSDWSNTITMCRLIGVSMITNQQRYPGFCASVRVSGFANNRARTGFFMWLKEKGTKIEALALKTHKRIYLPPQYDAAVIAFRHWKKMTWQDRYPYNTKAADKNVLKYAWEGYRSCTMDTLRGVLRSVDTLLFLPIPQDAFVQALDFLELSIAQDDGGPTIQQNRCSFGKPPPVSNKSVLDAWLVWQCDVRTTLHKLLSKQFARHYIEHEKFLRDFIEYICDNYSSLSPANLPDLHPSTLLQYDGKVLTPEQNRLLTGVQGFSSYLSIWREKYETKLTNRGKNKNDQSTDNTSNQAEKETQKTTTESSSLDDIAWSSEKSDTGSSSADSNHPKSKKKPNHKKVSKKHNSSDSETSSNSIKTSTKRKLSKHQKTSTSSDEGEPPNKKKPISERKTKSAPSKKQSTKNKNVPDIQSSDSSDDEPSLNGASIRKQPMAKNAKRPSARQQLKKNKDTSTKKSQDLDLDEDGGDSD